MRTHDPALVVPGASPGAQAHILVVDDEPQIRTLLAMALRHEGYQVTVREDGIAALDEIQRGNVSVLLTDLKMPRMNGLELIKTARSLRPDVASILITAFASTETAVEALRFGADDYLAKPFALDELRRVVDRVLTSRRLVSAERDAGARARDEAENFRERSVKAEQALAVAERDLTLSRADLERRVRDLEFVAEMTRLLAREGDLERVLSTTVRVLLTRFDARVARIELALDDGVRVAQHAEGTLPPLALPALGSDLVARARASKDGVLRDVVLGYGRPLEALVASLSVGSGGCGGGMTVLREAPPREDPGDLFLLSLVAPALGVAIEADLQRRAAERNALDVALGILEVLESRGAFQQGHAARVAALAGRMAVQLNLSPRLKSVIETAARLHDVGEVGVPDALLQRRGPLSPEEMEVVRSHAVLGSRLLAPFGEAAAFVRHHHERPDGTGYPDRLRGDDIPLGAAIVGVAEAFDAMTHARPYRASRSRATALDEIHALRGTQFVPAAVDALLSLPVESL